MSRMLTLLAVLVAGAAGADPDMQLHGSGTTNPSKFFWNVMEKFQCRAKVPLSMSYRAVGSSTGQNEFVGTNNGNVAWNHFGSGDIPMKSQYFAALKAAGRSMVHVPIAIGGIGIFHSVPKEELPTQGRIHLSSCVLAKVFARIITTWDDPEIMALNEGFLVPKGQEINVVHRVHGSSSTSGVTQYMDLVCPEQWSKGPKKMQTGSKIDWDPATTGRQGSGGVTAEIKSTKYSIGYIDAGHGHSAGFGEVELKNKNGKYVDSRSSDIFAAADAALAAGVLPADPSVDHSAVNLYDQAGDKTWPITMMSYFYINKDLSAMDKDTAALLKAFVTFATTDKEGIDIATSYKFVPLPQSVQTKNLATLKDEITWPAGMVDFTFETAASVLKDADGNSLGGADRIISGKRQCISTYTRQTTDMAISSINAVLAPKTTPTNQGATVDAPDGKMSLNPTDPDNASPIAIASFIIALLALSLSAYSAYCKKNAKALPQ